MKRVITRLWTEKLPVCCDKKGRISRFGRFVKNAYLYWFNELCNNIDRMPKQFFIFILCALFLMSCNQSEKKPVDEIPEQAEAPSTYIYGICIDSLNVESYAVKSGESFSTIFNAIGFTSLESENIVRSISAILNPTKLRAGTRYDVFTTQDSIENAKYLVFAQSYADFVVIDLTSDSVNVYPFQKTTNMKRKYIEGTITSSLWNEIKNKGENPLLALELSDIYAWQIDFFDIKEGDSFRVLYDVPYIDDSIALDNNMAIRTAIFTHRGKDYHAIPFEQDSIYDFYDWEGNSLKKAFLKAPLDFYRISSHFSNSRFHPVLKRHRAHHGVDYAAPVGTPVKTIGDGTVIEKSYQANGAGHYLKIKHNATYTTTYMHLSKYASGIAVGSRVRQGEVVAYVGSTGLSTGPHLDFRVHKNGTPINPLSMESPPLLPIKEELKDSFNIAKERYANMLKDFKNIDWEDSSQQKDAQ